MVSMPIFFPCYYFKDVVAAPNQSKHGKRGSSRDMWCGGEGVFLTDVLNVLWGYSNGADRLGEPTQRQLRVKDEEI